jgi:hypothetical protein
VWRHHEEVTRQLETGLEREEQHVPAFVLWKDIAEMEWIPPQDPVEEHASVSIDGVKVLIRDEGYREVNHPAASWGASWQIE